MENLPELFKQFLKKAFDIKEAEINRALLMFAYIFLIITSLLIVKPTAASLFLNKFGVERLPYAFLLVAIFAAIVSTIYSRLIKIYPLDTIILYTLYSSMTAFALFWALLIFNFIEGWVLYTFYVWVAIFAVLSASQFWVFANIVFNAREAKRLFGFIGAGAIAGGIFGGYLTTISVTIIGSENLLLVTVFFLGLCVPITKHIWKVYVGENQTKYQRKKKIFSFADHPIKLIIQSRHLTYLAGIVGVSVLVAKLVDYQFSAIATYNFYNEDELTAFFAFWFSNLNIVSLLIQLFITRRIVGVFGVGVSLFFLPGGILVGALAILVSPMLWSAILLKISDGSLKQSVNKAGMELLALPIPVEIKNQAKSFIDIFIDSFATGISGIVLILAGSVLGISTRYISLITILFLIFWFYLAWKVRKEYIRSFKIKIESGKEDKRKIPDMEKESVIGSLVKVLESGNNAQKIQILKMIRDFSNESFVSPLKQLIKTDSEEVLLETMKVMHNYIDDDFYSAAENLIKHNNDKIKSEAINYIFNFPEENESELIRSYLNHEDPRVRELSMFCAASIVRENVILKNELNYFEIINGLIKRNELERGSESYIGHKVNHLRLIGIANINELFYYIHEQIQNENNVIKNVAIESAGLTTNPQFIDLLIGLLEDENHRQTARSALINYGPLITETLIPYINSAYNPIIIRREIPSILEKIGTQKSVDALYDCVDHEDISIRNSSLKALNNLKKTHPHLNYYQKSLMNKILAETQIYLESVSYFYLELSIHKSEIDSGEISIKEARKSLTELLEKRMDGNLERIFRLLGLKYPPQEMIEVYKSIQSSKPDLRINAIEFLDNLLEPNLKKVIIPIVESAGVQSITQDVIEELDIKIPSEMECLENLLNGKDTKLVIASLFLIAQLKEEKYLPLAGRFINHPNPKVKNMAELAKSNLLGAR